MLVFVMGCAFGLFLVGGIVLVALGNDTLAAGIVSFVGSVASGVAMAWIVKQRNDASTQVDQALELVDDYCKQPEVTIAELDAGAAPTELVVEGS